MCRSCQAEIDRAVGMLSTPGRRLLLVAPHKAIDTPVSCTPFSDMCAALLLAAKLRRARACLGRIDTTAYGTSPGVIDAAVPQLCAVVVQTPE